MKIPCFSLKYGMPAYITKRFDVNDDGAKLAQDDFTSLAGRTVEEGDIELSFKISDSEEILRKLKNPDNLIFIHPDN